MKKQTYDKKKKRELEFYSLKKKKTFFSNLLNLRIFHDPKSSGYNYKYAALQMERFVAKKLKGNKIDKILIAPCGSGNDYKYLAKFSKDIYGIDLSPIQIDRCPKQMKAKVADILNSGYNDKYFDFVASLGFFHHYIKNVGFDAFLREFHRLLKPKGKLIIMEPSIFHPFFAFTRPIKKIFNNPYGEVKDEGPFRPKLMLDALKRSGFINIDFHASTFSHMCFYIPIAKIVNWITNPLLNKWPFKLFGWMVLYWAEKEK